MKNPLIEKTLTAEELKEYIIQKDTELEQDYQERTSGITNTIGNGYKMAGYINLRKFFEGDHWSYFKDDGTPNRVYNYCRTTVLNYTSFLANEPPEDDVPPRDNLDEIEIARSEEVEKILQEIKDDNHFPIIFNDAVQNQSLLGECFIFGPYVQWLGTGKKKRPRIRFSNVKRVENVRIIWADENFDDYTGFIFHYRVSLDKAEQIYAEQMKKRNIFKLGADEPIRYQKETGVPMATIKIYWDDTYMLAMVNERVIDFAIHNWEFVPGIFVKNAHHDTRPWGISDIEDILDAQVEYNESISSTRGKINQVAIPHVFYSGEGEPISYEAGNAQMIRIGPEDKIFPDPMGQSTAPFDNYTLSRKNDIHQLSMISEIFHGSAGLARTTGRALSVLMQGVNNKVRTKQQFWLVALRKLNANILRLIEEYVPDGKKLIQGYYKTDIFFPSILIRNTMEEINKFNMKLQSQYTTMKNLGIPSPKEELKIMKREWDDTSLMVEISRNPQLRMQLQQMMASQIAQVLQQLPGQQPQLTEEEGGAGRTAEEELPMATASVPQQSPVSGEGAIAQKAFRGR